VRKLMVFALVAVVLAIVLAPACTLAPTALRSLLLAHALLFGMALTIVALVHVLQRMTLAVESCEPRSCPQSLHCVFIC
jgi:hypothetical protein